MEQKRVSTVCSDRHIPKELWPNILSRLPVKSLLRFRCVSKSWLSLINDPDFCRLHLKNFKNNNDETHLLVAESKPKRCVVRCSDTFETNTDILLTLPRSYHEGEWWKVEFSVDGLVLLRSGKRDLSDDEELMVWNPSIRKFHDIPSLNSVWNVSVGLGYDPLAKDYKLFTLVFEDHDDEILHSVAVYTLGAASWKIIQFQGKGFSNWIWDTDIVSMHTVYFRGSLYFLVVDKERFTTELLSIDVSSEVFSCISLPDGIYRCVGGPITIVDGGCSLAIFDLVNKLTMWVLGSESMCWTKRYSFDLRVPVFLYLKKNGDMLMQWIAKPTSFRLLAGNELVQQWTVV